MHYWVRELTALGHEVRAMAPVYVKPYRKGNKTDSNDAEALCEAVQRPNMRFVTARTPEQQSVLHLHHSRQLLLKQRVAQVRPQRAEPEDIFSTRDRQLDRDPLATTIQARRMNSSNRPDVRLQDLLDAMGYHLANGAVSM